ncbi:LysR family transcriptional regulator [Acetobacter sacchari]|uniref:LysR family transcriptional regulator n=1 Tax=Acetobacter sacchari TaxID=2661687 RepID=A0ABS3LX20_9PROT|nr:LysR substrate-binding domain-containing protein [Acetobacter sacchari]MBO1360428.1 LysR family transcriptional regulator [Acetobacter sacchari]
MAYTPLSGLSLRDIEYVVAVDDLRNFSRAAERCGVSQAGLSEQVRKLELLLGVTVFERSRRHVSPTPEGARLIAIGREVLASARMLLDVARSRTGPLDGPLRIGVIATLGPYYVPGLLSSLRSQYPQLALRLTENMTGPLLLKLRQNELDLALLSLPLASETLVSEQVFVEPFLGVFPKGHALAEHDSLPLDRLDGPELILLEDGHCLREQALSLCGAQSSHDGDSRLATSLEMLWHMIAAGEGYSLIPRLALANRTQLADLVGIRELDHQASRLIGLVWRRSDPRGPAFSDFARFLRANCPEGCTPVDPAA